MRLSALQLKPLSYADIPGWQDDDQSLAVGALKRSAHCLQAVLTAEHRAGAGLAVDTATPTPGRANTTVEAAADAFLTELKSLPEGLETAAARAYFEAHFTPFAHGANELGFLTGYYEPVLDGARRRGGAYQIPVYRLPDDLVKISDDRLRGHLDGALTAARKTEAGPVPYYTRREIEEGALAGRGLELLYLADAVDAFFLHVQGSGLIRLADEAGRVVRIGYAGKNGHPYTSIGELLIERGEIAAEDMTLEALRAWLEADALRGRQLMQENRSYIFFEEQAYRAGEGPLGAAGVPLEAGRSLAVDAGLIDLGLPVFVVSERLRHHGQTGFRRLMVAQDVGSAIKGRQRGDIFWGTGDEAGRLAGETMHEGRFIILVPNPVVDSLSGPNE